MLQSRLRKIILLLLGLILVIIPALLSRNVSGIPATHQAIVTSSPSITPSPSVTKPIVCAVTVALSSANLCIRDLKGQSFPFASGTQATKICVQGAAAVNLVQQRGSRVALLSTRTTLRQGCHQVSDVPLVALSTVSSGIGGKVGYLGEWGTYQGGHKGIIRLVACQGRSDFFTLFTKGGQKICFADHGLIRISHSQVVIKICGGRNTGDVIGPNFAIHLKGWEDCAFIPAGGAKVNAIYIRPLHFGSSSAKF